MRGSVERLGAVSSVTVVLESSKLRPSKLRLKAPWSVCLHTRVSQQPVEPSPPVLRRSPAAAGDQRRAEHDVVYLRLQQRRRRVLKSAVSVPTSTFESINAGGNDSFGGRSLAAIFLVCEVGRGAADFTGPQAHFQALLSPCSLLIVLPYFDF